MAFRPAGLQSHGVGDRAGISPLSTRSDALVAHPHRPGFAAVQSQGDTGTVFRSDGAHSSRAPRCLLPRARGSNTGKGADCLVKNLRRDGDRLAGTALSSSDLYSEGSGKAAAPGKSVRFMSGSRQTVFGKIRRSTRTASPFHCRIHPMTRGC